MVADVQRLELKTIWQKHNERSERFILHKDFDQFILKLNPHQVSEWEALNTLWSECRCRQVSSSACVSGRVQLRVKCEWVVVITASWGHAEKLEGVTDHILLWLRNAPDHAESRWSSYSPVMSTAATLTGADTVQHPERILFRKFPWLLHAAQLCW